MASTVRRLRRLCLQPMLAMRTWDIQLRDASLDITVTSTDEPIKTPYWPMPIEHSPL
jgi:hypothetical protein